MNLQKTPSYTRNTVLLGASVLEYWRHYFGSRSYPGDQEFYVVYTNIDHGIPFQPDSALDYWLINFKLIPCSIRLADAMSGSSWNNVRHAYACIAGEGAAAFSEVPTIMPYFAGRSRHALRLAHTLLKPINCSPSLHTAAPFFIYNLGAKYFPEKEPELRGHVGNVVSTIIRTKLHALIDVAFGIFLSERIIGGRLGLDFNNLESFFTAEQQRQDKLPYEQVYRIYHEIKGLAETKQEEEASLPRVMKSYFQEIGLPRVRREQSNCFYDLKQKALIYSPELKVGKGLV